MTQSLPLEIEEKYIVDSFTETMDLTRSKFLNGYNSVRIYCQHDKKHNLTCHKSNAPVEEVFTGSTT